MGNLKPGKNIVYERDDKGNVWGRYHGETGRWLIGGPGPEYQITFREWQDIMDTAETNSTLKSLVEKTINTYRLIKS